MKTEGTKVALETRAEVERQFAHSRKILGAAMTNDNQDALRCATSLENTAIHGTMLNSNMDAAAHLRRLVRENKAKDALLRQAVQELEWAGYRDELVAAIRRYLDQKTT